MVKIVEPASSVARIPRIDPRGQTDEERCVRKRKGEGYLVSRRERRAGLVGFSDPFDLSQEPVPADRRFDLPGQFRLSKGLGKDLRKVWLPLRLLAEDAV